MKYLTTKTPLYLYELPSGPLITLEPGSTLKLISTKESYHAYYELHSYSLNVEIDNKKYVVNCARYKDAKGSRSIRVNSSTSFNKKNKALNWDQVFEEECEINTEN
jgi:hypothetical protein